MLRQMKRTPQYRSIKRRILSGTFLFVTIVLILGLVCLKLFGAKEEISEGSNGRRLLFDTPDAFTAKQRSQGAVVLHLIGLFYMFLAIAIVCDEFFVPSIEIIVDKLKMSPDTAGATFMAAGGSAPELFTSFIGTFITQDGVGFGTIVGSAVFNVLFVIGCCAIFSSGELVLTWWPFARDSTYYCCSLLVLALFFGLLTPNEIYHYEAIVLLLLYVTYVVMMMKNEQLWVWVQRTFVDRTKAELDDTTQIKVTRPLNFTVSIFDMMTRDASLEDIAGIHMVARIKGDVRSTFRQVDENEDGTVDIDEFRKVIRRLGRHISEQEVKDCFDEIDDNKNGKIEFEEFEKWYLRSTWRMKQDIEAIFLKFDKDSSGSIDVRELKELLKAVNHSVPSQSEVDEARKILDANGDGQISWEEFLNWYETSIFFKEELKRRETVAQLEEEQEAEGFSLAFPHNTWGRVFWVVSMPIVLPLYFTVPDVRKERWKKWYAFSFIMAIAWLGIYSYWMVAWATFFGDVTGIPPPVMGLTLLAAGTSVPDLLTSIIVARHGEGDMAVSSSIGSNIFDILVGLPLPWFLYSISLGLPKGRVKVGADGLIWSILILFAMIAAVLIIIKCSNWRMTKTLGYSMFVLYFLFVIQDLCRTYLA